MYVCVDVHEGMCAIDVRSAGSGPYILRGFLSNGPIAFRSRRALSRVGHYRHSLYWNRSITSRPNLRRQPPLAESPSIRIYVKARAHPRASAGRPAVEDTLSKKARGVAG